MKRDALVFACRLSTPAHFNVLSLYLSHAHTRSSGAPDPFFWMLLRCMAWVSIVVLAFTVLSDLRIGSGLGAASSTAGATTKGKRDVVSAAGAVITEL